MIKVKRNKESNREYKVIQRVETKYNRAIASEYLNWVKMKITS